MQNKITHYSLIVSRYSILAFVFIVAFSSAVAAKNSAGQALDPKNTFLTIQVDGKPLKGVFSEIEQQSKCKFFYDANNLDPMAAITMHVKNESLYNILLQLSEQLNLDFKQVGNYFSVRTIEKQHVGTSVATPAATRRLDFPDTKVVSYSYVPEINNDIIIRGKVTDEKDNPLQGVSVLVKSAGRESSIGTTTDVNGNFDISLVSANTTLVFSYVGFENKEVKLNGRTTVNVSLTASVSGLNEVVVVGYGTQKKSVVTGAISSVKASELENQQIGNLSQALQGRASGLTIAASSGAPGAAATVTIRGTTSLNDGANDPLYVVDGVVVGSGGIDYLNPNDIESIEVLKDAASAAIYGARSSAGVILVTTKKGKPGDVKVNYNGYYGMQAPAKKLKLLDATQYATLMNEQSANDGGPVVFADPASYGKGTDWQSLIFNDDAKIQNHEVSISGGSEKATFYTSFGYYDQEGIIAPSISNYKRYNIRLNSSYKITKWLTFGQTAGYSHINNKGNVAGNTDFGGPLSSAIMMDPITKSIITDPVEANAVPYSTQPVERDKNGNPYGISNYVVQQVTNPLAYIQTEQGNYNWSDDIVGNVFLEAEPVKGLKLRSTVGTTLSYWGSENFNPLFYLNSNQFSTQTSFARNRQKSANWNIENTVSYSKSLSEHNFTVLLGQGAYLDNNSSGINVTYFNLPVNTFKEASMNYSISATDISAGGYEGIHHTVSSLFGRLTYDYSNKYLFTGIIRRDGSSRFGSNNKFGYFPSASVGWVASREDFFPAKESINFLKLRGSYGITGSDVLGNFRYLSTVGGGRNYTFGGNLYEIGYSPDAPANPDLKWEQTSQLNFGLDMVLFTNWNVTFDWYNKKTTGILQTIQFPAYVGATGSSYGNVADMENKGLELELGYQKTIGEVKINVKVNVSHLKNDVTYLGDGKEFLDGGANLQSSTYPLTRTAVGYAVGSFYGFKTEGIFQNQGEINAYVGKDGKPIQPTAVPGDFKWADLNGDGQITEADRTFIGDPIPDWSYGFNFNVSWKNFDLIVFGQGVSGNQIFQGLRRMDIPTANWQTDFLNRWHGEGTSNEYPRLTIKDKNKNLANPSDFRLQNGDYFRIKTLQIGYSLPKNVINKAGLKTARIYLSSNNLITVTKYTGFDPEIGGSSYGIDRAIYPQSRSFLLGLNLGF